MPIITAVAADVDSKRDEFRSIDAHKLASLLDIVDAHHPGGDYWKFVSYIARVPIEDIIRWDKETVLELFQPHVTAERYEELDKRYEELESKRLMSDFLTKSEKEAIERAYMEKQDDAYDSRCLAFYTINAPHLKKLIFEASIEDDGHCVDLKTPYDERDDGFTYLSDCRIVEDSG